MTVPNHSIPETVEPLPTAPVPSSTPTPLPPLRPQQRPIVVIDPGHGGPDPGAIGIGGIYEKEIVLDISLQAARLLENQGIQVVLTRQADVDLGLQPRVEIANRARADLFVSIHANAISMSRPEVNGIETYHVAGSESGQRLAASIQQQLLTSTGMRDRGVKRARFYVLVHTRMPAVDRTRGCNSTQRSSHSHPNGTGDRTRHPRLSSAPQSFLSVRLDPIQKT